VVDVKFKLPGPGTAALVAAAVAAAAAAYPESDDLGGWSVHLSLVALAFMLGGVGLAIERLHVCKEIRLAEIAASRKP